MLSFGFSSLICDWHAACLVKKMLPLLVESWPGLACVWATCIGSILVCLVLALGKQAWTSSAGLQVYFFSEGLAHSSVKQMRGILSTIISLVRPLFAYLCMSLNQLLSM